MLERQQEQIPSCPSSRNLPQHAHWEGKKNGRSFSNRKCMDHKAMGARSETDGGNTVTTFSPSR
ncbi:MAG: hypothetical protein MUO29_09115, partial [Desulfobacterales bacterium]|nr:hypothetical protein [Desulfobacterales bacterium]